MPQLYEHLNPMPYEAAAQMEKELAEDGCIIEQHHVYTVVKRFLFLQSGPIPFQHALK